MSIWNELFINIMMIISGALFLISGFVVWRNCFYTVKPEKKYRLTYGIATTFVYARSKRQARRECKDWYWIYRHWGKRLKIEEVKEGDETE
jgi:hypothetical protein